MPGYKIFLQDGRTLREALKCSHCQLVLRDPIQTTETGVRFCRECYNEAVRYVSTFNFSAAHL